MKTRTLSFNGRLFWWLYLLLFNILIILNLFEKTIKEKWKALEFFAILKRILKIIISFKNCQISLNRLPNMNWLTFNFNNLTKSQINCITSEWVHLIVQKSLKNRNSFNIWNRCWLFCIFIKECWDFNF